MMDDPDSLYADLPWRIMYPRNYPELVMDVKVLGPVVLLDRGGGHVTPCGWTWDWVIADER